MSTQEENLKAIADAIRQKEGTTEPIPANDFPARIRALETGGGSSDYAIPLVVTSDTAGAEITAVNGDTVLNGITGSDKKLQLILTKPGDWAITAKYGDRVEGPNYVNAMTHYTTKLNVLSRLPVGYSEVQYLYKEKNEYNVLITTDYIPQETDKIEAVIKISAFASAVTILGFGANSLSSQTKIGINANGSNGKVGAMHLSINGGQYKFTKVVTGTTAPIDIVLDFGDSSATVDGQTISDIAYNFYDGQYPLTLLCATEYQYNYALYGYFYSCKVYRGLVVIADYVPCVETNTSEVGLYDVVAGKFFKQTGKGAKFQAGPVVE